MIALLALTACGGGDGTDDPRSEYLDKGNAICRDAKADIRRAVRQGSGAEEPTSLNQVARQTVIPRLEGQLTALRQLPVPPADASILRELLGSLQSALEQSMRQPFTFGPAEDSPFATPDRLARVYGLTACVSG